MVSKKFARMKLLLALKYRNYSRDSCMVSKKFARMKLLLASKYLKSSKETCVSCYLSNAGLIRRWCFVKRNVRNLVKSNVPLKIRIFWTSI